MPRVVQKLPGAPQAEEKVSLRWHRQAPWRHYNRFLLRWNIF